MGRPVWLLDFDNTAALSFEPAPNGMQVPQATNLAVLEVFGQRAFDRYVDGGGLHNRSPIEITCQLAPGLTGKALMDKADELVKVKLSYLLPQIGQALPDGQIWPRLTKGFGELWRFVSMPSERGLQRRGILSSGHASFIKATFQVHDLRLPDTIVCDDDMRRIENVPVERLSKPDPLILYTACARLGAADLAEIIYFGDDAIKDGLLAKNAGVRFGHFDERLGESYEPTSGGDFAFGDWSVLLDHLD